jgi:hypothetical protein
VYSAHLEQVVDQLLDALVPFGAHLSKFRQPQAQVSKQNMAAILFSMRKKTTFYSKPTTFGYFTLDNTAFRICDPIWHVWHI